MKGCVVDTDSHDVVKEISTTANVDFSEDSVMKLFWEQQKLSASYRSSSSMKLHLMIIRWGLSIYLQSPGIHYATCIYYCTYVNIYH